MSIRRRYSMSTKALLILAAILVVVTASINLVFREPRDVRETKLQLSRAVALVQEVGALEAAKEFKNQNSRWWWGERESQYFIVVRLSTGGQLTGLNSKEGEEPDVRLVPPNKHGQAFGALLYEAMSKTKEGYLSEVTYFAALPSDRGGPEYPKRMFVNKVGDFGVAIGL